MQKHRSRPFVKSLLFGFLAFLLVLAITIFVGYQQIQFQEKKDKEELLRELSHVTDRFRNILYSDISAANSFAIVYKEFGDRKNFDSLAAQVLRQHKFVEVLQLTVNGVITNVYPLKGYEETIGINTLADPLRTGEVFRAKERKGIYFAGPRKLRKGGEGILGKVPLSSNGKENIVFVVLTKLETIRAELEQNSGLKGRFAYNLVKRSSGNEKANYFLTNTRPSPKSQLAATEIPEGDWLLQVTYSKDYAGNNFPPVTALMGSLLALLTGILTYRASIKPYSLKKIIAEKTEELAGKEEYFRTLLQTSTDAVVLMDETGKVLYQTPSTEKISGYSLAEIQQLDAKELIHPESRESSHLIFRNLLRTPGGQVMALHRFRHKKGYYIWIEGTYRNLLQEESVKAVVYNYTDVTQRIKAERDLKERIKELATIFQISFILQDQEQETTKAFARILEVLPGGWQYSEICQASIGFAGNIYHTQGYQPSPYRQSAPFTLYDGRTGYIEVLYTRETTPEAEGPFLKDERDLLNTLAEMVKVYLNKKSQEESLIRSEANLKTIFDNTQVSFLLLDSQYKVLAFNNHFYNTYLEQTGQALQTGANFLDATLPESREKAKSNFDMVLQTGQPINYETVYPGTGNTKYVDVTISPVVTAGRIIGMCISVIDVTAKKNLEKERQKMLSELIVRNQRMEDFAAMVSHNLRAPLSNILGLSNLFKEELPEKEKKFIVTKLKSSAEQMDEVVKEMNQILYFQNNFSEQAIAVDLCSLVAEIKESFKTPISSAQATIECNFKGPVELVTIRSFVHNIFYNLISNSLNFRQPDLPPHIKLWTEKETGKVVIFYMDNGLGIDMDLYGGQLFGLNKRFHPTISGKGLGLFMVKAQVESLNGTISVKSKVNEGTIFKITLPATQT